METIIVQETNKDILDVLSTVLEVEGFKVYALTAFDDNFLDLIEHTKPHVVILDYLYSGEDSIRLCREIKQVYPHLPVLALSCNSNINQVYNKYGFDGYIEKPFDLDLLYRILRKHIPVIQSST